MMRAATISNSPKGASFMRSTVFAALVATGISCSAHAQAPAGCNSSAALQQLKEVFYTQMLDRGRAAKTERFADPYSGSPESFAAGVKKAGDKLQAEIKVLSVVDQGYKDQIKAQFCAATLVVANNQSFAVPARYFVQRTVDGAPKVAAEFQLPGGGGLASFNSLIAFFNHFYAIAFPAQAEVAAPVAATPPKSAAKEEDPTPRAPGEIAEREFQDADKALNAAYRKAMSALSQDGKVKLRTEQRGWIGRRDKTCAQDTDAGIGPDSAGALDASACATKFTNDRTAELLKISASK